MRAIESHVRGLDRALTGPGRLKADMLREVRHGLVDAAEAYEAEGDADPERRAIAEFGAVPEVAPAYQAELATSATRSVALRVTAAYGVGAFAANLMWTGAPWAGQPPPGAFQVLAEIIDVVGNGLAVFGAVTLAALWLRSRSGRTTPMRRCAWSTAGWPFCWWWRGRSASRCSPGRPSCGTRRSPGRR